MLDRPSPKPPPHPPAPSRRRERQRVWQRRYRARQREGGQPPLSLARNRFRTFQACPKDLSILIWQVERAGDPPSNREGHAMDEIDRTQRWISDTQAMGLYSTLLFVVIVLWVYVPA